MASRTKRVTNPWGRKGKPAAAAAAATAYPTGASTEETSELDLSQMSTEEILGEAREWRDGLRLKLHQANQTVARAARLAKLTDYKSPQGDSKALRRL